MPRSIDPLGLKRTITKIGKKNRELKKRIGELETECSRLAHRCAGDYARGYAEGSRAERLQRELRTRKRSG